MILPTMQLKYQITCLGANGGKNYSSLVSSILLVLAHMPASSLGGGRGGKERGLSLLCSPTPSRELARWMCKWWCHISTISSCGFIAHFIISIYKFWIVKDSVDFSYTINSTKFSWSLLQEIFMQITCFQLCNTFAQVWILVWMIIFVLDFASSFQSKWPNDCKPFLFWFLAWSCKCKLTGTLKGTIWDQLNCIHWIRTG